MHPCIPFRTGAPHARRTRVGEHWYRHIHMVQWEDTHSDANHRAYLIENTVFAQIHVL